MLRVIYQKCINMSNDLFSYDGENQTYFISPIYNHNWHIHFSFLCALTNCLVYTMEQLQKPHANRSPADPLGQNNSLGNYFINIFLCELGNCKNCKLRISNYMQNLHQLNVKL